VTMVVLFWAASPDTSTLPWKHGSGLPMGEVEWRTVIRPRPWRQAARAAER